MSDKLDMALDDIIKTTKGSRGSGGGARRGSGAGRGGFRGGRGGPRSQGPGAGGRRGGSGGGGFRSMSNGSNRGGMTTGRWNHDMFQGGATGGAGARFAPQPLMSSGSSKLNVSNLDFGVSDSDIKELFQEFGDLKSAVIHYDRTGRSLGSAQIVFSRFSDAQKAVKQYNGVHLDGRPMKITLDGDNKSLGMGGGGGGGGMGGSRPMVKRLNQGRSVGGGMGRGGSRGAPARRGSSRGGRGGRGGRSERPKPKTAEELDAELESYVTDAKKDTSAKDE